MGKELFGPLLDKIETHNGLSVSTKAWALIDQAVKNAQFGSEAHEHLYQLRHQLFKISQVSDLFQAASTGNTLSMETLSLADMLLGGGTVEQTLRIKPGDLIGRTDAAKQELYRASFLDTLKDWIIAAWQKFMEYLRTVLNWIKTFLGIIDCKSKAVQVEQMEAVLRRIDPKKVTPTENYQILASDVAARMQAINRALGELVNLNMRNMSTFEDPKFPFELARRMNSALGGVGFVMQPDGQLNIQDMQRYKDRSLSDLGWTSGVYNSIISNNNEIVRYAGKLQGSAAELYTAALAESKRIAGLPAASPDLMQRTQSALYAASMVVSTINQLLNQVNLTHQVALSVVGTLGADKLGAAEIVR